LRRSDLALVCDLGAAARLPSRDLLLLQAVVEALPPGLAERTCVFLAVDAEEVAARRLLLPWVESFDLRCRVLSLAAREPEARAFDLARAAALAEARAVLLLGDLGPAAALREAQERRGARRSRWGALLPQPALLRLAAAGAEAAPSLQREASLERQALPLLDALWLPPAAAEGLRRLGAALPEETETFTPPCTLAESLLPWLAAAGGTAREAPGAVRRLLCFAPLGAEGGAKALLAALEIGFEGSPLPGLTLVGPAGIAPAPELLEAAETLRVTRGLAVELLSEAELPALAGRLVELGLAATVLPPPGTVWSEPLDLCRRLGLPTLATASPALEAQLAGGGFSAVWSPAEPAALAAALLRLLAPGAPAPVFGPGALRRTGELPAGFGSRLEALVEAGALPAGRAGSPPRIAVVLRGAPADPDLYASLLALQDQSLPPSAVLLIEEEMPPAGPRPPPLLLPPPLPARRFAAADEPAWRQALDGLDVERLLFLKAGDLPAPWMLESLAAETDRAAGTPPEALSLPVTSCPGALLPDPAAPLAGVPTDRPDAAEEPLWLPPSLLGSPLRPRRLPAADCLRRRGLSARPLSSEAAGEAARQPPGAGPEQRLAVAAGWLHDAVPAERPPRSLPTPALVTAAPRPAGPPFAGLLLGYAPRAGAALLLATLQGHPGLGIAAAEAFAGVPGSRQLDHLALLRRRARGLRGRRFVVRGQLAHCADAEGLAAAAERHDLAVVVLQRQNRVRQAISQLNAERCRLRHGTEHPCGPVALPPLQLAPALLEERLEALAEGERRMEAALAPLLARAPGRVFLLTYEQLETALPAVTAALLSLLGLAPRPLTAGLCRLTPERSAQALADQEALLALYRGSPLAALLRDPAEGG